MSFLLYLKKCNLSFSGLFLIYVNLLHPKPFFCYFSLEFHNFTKLISISRFSFNFKIFACVLKITNPNILTTLLFLCFCGYCGSYGVIETSCYFFIVDFSFKMLYNTFLMSSAYKVMGTLQSLTPKTHKRRVYP